ncbi:hypothetical protein FGO68_gene14896 [Halteria grandinella]|uniref:Mitochondrial carrier protein n=1 Tax=Halteria grandinella TaxID=5974 RepID=A0A8J8T0H5_HALGN|nr:hypothetical protein FGO68_gene14896 [Halteria grandinella]
MAATATSPHSQSHKITLRFFYEQVFASTISNMLGIIIGHPLDTVKVRMQMDGTQTSVRRCLQEMLAKEGTSGFFKGLMSPLAAATPFCALIFTINELCKRQLDKQHVIRVEQTTKSLITGCFSGAVGVMIYTPIEVLKCRAQATKEEKPSYRKLVPKIISEEGYKGLYRGCFVQAMRDVPGWGIYFYSYEVFKHLMYRMDNITHGKTGTEKPSNQRRQVGLDLMAGGLAGSFSWFIGYPIDIVKTQIQVSTEKVAPSISQVLRRGYAEQGIGYFFRGLSPTLIRAFPVNAVTLASFDMLQRWVKHDNVHRDDPIEKPLL